MVPVILRLDSAPAGGSMAAVVNVVPAAITILELMVTGEAPTMLDAVRVVPGPMSKFVVTVSSDPCVILEVVSVPIDAVPVSSMLGPRKMVPDLTSPPAVSEPDTVRFGL